MTLSLIDRNQSHYRLTDNFAGPMFRDQTNDSSNCVMPYGRRTTELRKRFTERTDLWMNAVR